MRTDKILRGALLFGLFLVPFIPLIVVNVFFFPFITGKNFFFRVLVETLLGLWALLALRDARYRPSYSGILVALGMFLSVIALADIFGADPFKSFWSNLERMEGLLTLLHLGAYVLIAGTVLNIEKLWTRFWQASVGVSVLLSFYAFMQLAGVFTIHQGGVRVDATFGNATYLAVYLLFHIFIALILLSRFRGGGWGRFWYLSIVLVQAIALFYTATRGALLGITGGLLLSAILIALFERENRTLRKAALGLLFGILLMVGTFFGIRNTDFVMQNQVLSRIASISLEEGAPRFMIWNMAWQGVKERPLLGWGQENFNLVFNKYYDPRLHNQEPWFDHVHNIVLDWLIAGGVFGALAYFSIPLVTLYYIWRPQSRGVFSRTEQSLLTGLLAGYFFHNLFVFDNLISYILYGSLLAYVYARTRPELPRSVLKYALDRDIALRLGAPIVAVCMVSVIYFVNVHGMATASTLIKAFSSGGDIPLALDRFEKAFSLGSVGNQEVAEQLVLYAQQVRSADVDMPVKQRAFTLAEQAMRQQLERSPSDARLHFFYASLFAIYGQSAKALEEIEEVIKLSPNKQGTLLQKAALLMEVGRKEEGLALLKQTFELDRSNNMARKIYAAALLERGDLAAADALLIEAFRTTNVDDDRILNAYVALGRFERVKAIWEIRAQKNPNDAQVLASLAAAYLKVGDRAKAIETLRRAAEVEPKFKDQVDALILDIQAGKSF